VPFSAVQSSLYNNVVFLAKWLCNTLPYFYLILVLRVCLDCYYIISCSTYIIIIVYIGTLYKIYLKQYNFSRFYEPPQSCYSLVIRRGPILDYFLRKNLIWWFLVCRKLYDSRMPAGACILHMLLCVCVWLLVSFNLLF